MKHLFFSQLLPIYIRSQLQPHNFGEFSRGTCNLTLLELFINYNLRENNQQKPNVSVSYSAIVMLQVLYEYYYYMASSVSRQEKSALSCDWVPKWATWSSIACSGYHLCPAMTIFLNALYM